MLAFPYEVLMTEWNPDYTLIWRNKLDHSSKSFAPDSNGNVSVLKFALNCM